MTEGQAWVAVAWLMVIGMAVADSPWEAVLTFVVSLAALVASALLLRRFWP